MRQSCDARLRLQEMHLPKRCSQQPDQCALAIELHVCRGGAGHHDNDGAPAESTGVRVRQRRFSARDERLEVPGIALEVTIVSTTMLRLGIYRRRTIEL